MSGGLVFCFNFFFSSLASTQYFNSFSNMKRVKDLYYFFTGIFGIKKRLTLMLNFSFNFFLSPIHGFAF